MQKYVFLKLDLKVKRQYFRYKEYINWLQIDEILTYVFMYGGPSTSFLRYEPLKNDVTIFDPFSGLKTRFRHFPTPGDYLFVKMKNWRAMSIQCVIEASSFCSKRNMTLESTCINLSMLKKIKRCANFTRFNAVLFFEPFYEKACNDLLL